METILTPVCKIESMDPKDLASAIQTIPKLRPKTVIRITQLGLGYETFLKWAIQDIEATSATLVNDQKCRFSVSALMNARRSLSCLADQYLLRDGFIFCSDIPHDADGKAKLLVSRGIFDDLAAQALGRAVDRRNRVEHSYEQIALSDVQDTVHLIRATIENCVAKYDSYWAPAFFGSFLGGYSVGPDGDKCWFNGWSDLLCVIARFDAKPWLGVIVPSSKTEATVRKVFLSKLSCDQLRETLTALEEKSSNGYSGFDESLFRSYLKCAGLTT